MKIAFLGDIAFFGKYSLSNKSIYNYFREMSVLLKGYDHVVGNLEVPFIDDGRAFRYKSAHLFSNEKNIELLNFLNIDIVNLANNHLFDYGIKGYTKTKKILTDNNIKYFGIENETLFVTTDDAKIAFSGYCCYSTNALGYIKKNRITGINVLNGYEVEKKITDNHNNGYLNILGIHAGEEHVNYPNYDHIALARILSQKVPLIYYGHHPHVIQGIEEINNSLLAYSLGNFCFDDVYTKKSSKPLIKQNENNKKSFILSVEIIDNVIAKYEIIPFYLGDNEIIFENCGILSDIEHYSSFLKTRKNEYINIRTGLLNDYRNKRKTNRDIMWYLKRLNIGSLYMILSSKINRKKYYQSLTKYLNEKNY